MTLEGVQEELEELEEDREDTVLHRMAKVGDTEGVKRLLAGLQGQGAWQALQARNGQGSTALHVAAYYGREELVAVLLESGANPWHRNRHGWHAGHYASRWSQPRDIRLKIGLRPLPAASNSASFSYSRIRSRGVSSLQADTVLERKARLQCDSGISVLGSEESIPA